MNSSLLYTEYSPASAMGLKEKDFATRGSQITNNMLI